MAASPSCPASRRTVAQPPHDRWGEPHPRAAVARRQQDGAMRTTRVATAGDLEALVALTRAGPQRLASWSPVYWRPAAGAGELHPACLAHLLGPADPGGTALDANA